MGVTMSKIFQVQQIVPILNGEYFDGETFPALMSQQASGPAAVITFQYKHPAVMIGGELFYKGDIITIDAQGQLGGIRADEIDTTWTIL